jgi:vitamin B12 transporter
MKYLVCVITLLLCSTSAFAQEQKAIDAAESDDCIASGHGEYCGPLIVIGRDLDRVRQDQTSQEVELTLADGVSIERGLQAIAGLQQFRRSDARSANPTSQGITMRGLGGNASSRVLLVMDGVPQADPFGGWVSWPGYDASTVSEALVQRGGGSAAYGPGAIAGTIELLSKRPTNDADVMPIQLMFGSRGSLSAQSRLHGTMGPTVVMFTGGVERGDGFVPIVQRQRGAADRAAPYSNYGAMVRVLSRIATGTELQLNLRGFADRRDRGVPFTGNANSGVDASIRLVNRETPWQTSLTAYAQWRDLRSRFSAVSADRSTATPTLDQYSVPSTGIGARLEVDPTPAGGWGRVRFGADARAVDGETREYFQYLAGVAQRERRAGGSSRTVGGFADLEFGRDTVFLVSVNARVDQWRIAPGFRREVDIAGPATGTVRANERSAARSGWEWTGKLGMMVPVAESFELRAAAYRAWRLPTLNELYRPFRVGADAVAANPALSPERVRGAEIGFQWARSNVDVKGTLFYNQLNSAIANVTLANGPGVFPGVGFVANGGSYSQRQNLDAIRSTGFELDVEATPTNWLNVQASLAYTDARVRSSGVALALDGRRPAQVAKWSGSFGLEYHATDYGELRAGITLRYIGQQAEDDLGLQRLKSAFTVDATVKGRLFDGVSGILQIENLLNTEVQAGISRSGIIERASPRTIWLGLRLDIQ